MCVCLRNWTYTQPVMYDSYCSSTVIIVCVWVCVFSSRWRPSEQQCPHCSPAMSHHPSVTMETVSWCAPRNSMSWCERHGPTARAARRRSEQPRLNSPEPHSTGPASGSNYKLLCYIDQTRVLLELRFGRSVHIIVCGQVLHSVRVYW